MLQLYLHQLIKNNLQGQLRLTYNTPVKTHEFNEAFKYNSKMNSLLILEKCDQPKQSVSPSTIWVLIIVVDRPDFPTAFVY